MKALSRLTIALSCPLWFCFAAAQAPQSFWPQVGGNPQANMIGIGSGSIRGGNLGYNLPANASGQPAIGADGTMYVGTTNGFVEALTNLNGNLTGKWIYPVSNLAIVGTPLLSNGRIYVTANDGNMYALEDDGGWGTLDWSFQTGQGLVTSPVQGQSGAIILATSDPIGGGQLWSLSDGGSAATNNWGGGMRISSGTLSTPAVDTFGNIYVGDSSGAIDELSPNGLIGASQTGLVNPGPPMVGPNLSIYISDANGIYSFDSNLNLQWQYSTASPVAYPLAASFGGVIYYVDQDGALNALEDDGSSATLDWTDTETDYAGGASVQADGTLYVPYEVGPSYNHEDGIAVVIDYVGFAAESNNPISISNYPALCATPSINIDGSPVIAQNSTLWIQQANIVGSLSTSQNTVEGGGPSLTGTVFLAQNAGPNGAVVALSSSSPDVQIPSTVTVASNNYSQSFTISTSKVSSEEVVTLTATWGFTSAQWSVGLEPVAINALKVLPSSTVGGSTVQGEVTLNGIAPAGGVSVTLQNSDTTDATVQSTVTVPAGLNYAYFSIPTNPVSGQQTATITATHNSDPQQQATLTINPVPLTGLKFLSSSVQSGSSVIAEVTVAGSAVPPGESVSLSCPSSDISFPSSVTVPGGQSYVYFTVTTTPLVASDQVTLTATLGPDTKTATLLLGPSLSFAVKTLSSSLQGGSPGAGEVTLSTKLGSDQSVSLQSDSADVTVPSTVTVTAGSTYQYFNFTTAQVNSAETVTITATIGSTSHSCTLSLTQVPLSQLKTTVSSITGGNSFYGEVVLPQKAGGSGVAVALQSSSADATVPSSVTVPAGQNYVYFQVHTSAVASSEQVTITGTTSNSVQATVTVNPSM